MTAAVGPCEPGVQRRNGAANVDSTIGGVWY